MLDRCRWVQDLAQRVSQHHSSPCDEADSNEVRGVRLGDLVLPGSHDSAAHAAALAHPQPLPVAPDAPELLRRHASRRWTRPVLNLTRRWAVAQARSLGEQLRDGVRYLDLRVCRAPEPSAPERHELFFCHAILAERVADGLAQIGAFVREHPREVVVLDFNHFYDVDERHVEAAIDGSHQHLCHLLLSEFGSALCPRERATSLSDLSLADMWRHDESVVVLYGHAPTVERQPHLWPQSCIESPWPDTRHTRQLVQRLDQSLDRRQRDRLHVLQGVLTPSHATVAASLLPWRSRDPPPPEPSPSLPAAEPQRVRSRSANGLKSLHAVARLATPLIVSCLASRWGLHPNLNIVIVDFYDMHESAFIDTILALNERRFGLTTSTSTSTSTSVPTSSSSSTASDTATSTC